MPKLLHHHHFVDLIVEDLESGHSVALETDLLESLDHFVFNEKRGEAKVLESVLKGLGFEVGDFSIIVHLHVLAMIDWKHAVVASDRFLFRLELEV